MVSRIFSVSAAALESKTSNNPQTSLMNICDLSLLDVHKREMEIKSNFFCYYHFCGITTLAAVQREAPKGPWNRLWVSPQHWCLTDEALSPPPGDSPTVSNKISRNQPLRGTRVGRRAEQMSERIIHISQLESSLLHMWAEPSWTDILD